MTRICLVLIVACLPACRGTSQSAAPDGRDFPHVADTMDRTAPPLADLLTFTYSGTDAGTVTLKDGKWRGDGQSGDANVPEVVLRRDFRLTGDITGNGRAEAVVLLESRRPPAASRTYLAVVGWIGGQLVNIATTPISDEIVVRGGHIEPGHIILDALRRGSAEPVSVTYELDRTTLRLMTPQ
jgi:hypothetical protein